MYRVFLFTVFKKSQNTAFLHILHIKVSLALHLIGPSFFELVSQRGTELWMDPDRSWTCSQCPCLQPRWRQGPWEGNQMFSKKASWLIGLQCNVLLEGKYADIIPPGAMTRRFQRLLMFPQGKLQPANFHLESWTLNHKSKSVTFINIMTWVSHFDMNPETVSWSCYMVIIVAVFVILFVAVFVIVIVFTFFFLVIFVVLFIVVFVLFSVVVYVVVIAVKVWNLEWCFCIRLCVRWWLFFSCHHYQLWLVITKAVS